MESEKKLSEKTDQIKNQENAQNLERAKNQKQAPNEQKATASSKDKQVPEMKPLKKLTTGSIIYYVCSVVWFVSGVAMLLMQSNVQLGIAYMSIGAMWLCIGSVFLKREKKVPVNSLDYYNQNAHAFVTQTQKADMSALYDKFLPFVKEGGLILDWGCGSARDALHFQELGYEVEATDASQEICDYVSAKTGLEIRCERFHELIANEKYDAIWACASLLHVNRDGLLEAIETAKMALKTGGVIYMSFKYGYLDHEINGRYYTDMAEEKFEQLIKHVKRFEIVEQWVSDDVRAGHEEEQWFNVILRKNSK